MKKDLAFGNFSQRRILKTRIKYAKRKLKALRYQPSNAGGNPSPPAMLQCLYSSGTACNPASTSTPTPETNKKWNSLHNCDVGTANIFCEQNFLSKETSHLTFPLRGDQEMKVWPPNELFMGRDWIS